jgi:hypothetical protein
MLDDGGHSPHQFGEPVSLSAVCIPLAFLNRMRAIANAHPGFLHFHALHEKPDEAARATAICVAAGPRISWRVLARPSERAARSQPQSQKPTALSPTAGAFPQPVLRARRGTRRGCFRRRINGSPFSQPRQPPGVCRHVSCDRCSNPIAPVPAETLRRGTKSLHRPDLQSTIHRGCFGLVSQRPLPGPDRFAIFLAGSDR